jgi:hypothetical protein
MDCGLGIWEISTSSKHSAIVRGWNLNSIDFDGLIKLAQEIGAVNFILAYPNGKEDFYAEKAQSGGASVVVS